MPRKLPEPPKRLKDRPPERLMLRRLRTPTRDAPRRRRRPRELKGELPNRLPERLPRKLSRSTPDPLKSRRLPPELPSLKRLLNGELLV